MKIILIVLCLCPMTLFGQESEIQNVLDEQVTCWNAGDLECYMKGYWQSEELMFIGKTGITYGWSATLASYQKSYPDQATMGQLSLRLLEMDVLAENYYHVVGRWTLVRAVRNLEGHFSLLLERIDGEWLIVFRSLFMTRNCNTG